MKAFALLLAALAVPFLSNYGKAEDVCPKRAVFLALGDEIRGYPTNANGPTAPCQIIQGSNISNILDVAGNPIAISKHGDLHVAAFQDALFIFKPESHGDTAPERTVGGLCNNDFVSIAVDSHVNDFILGVEGDPTVSVSLDHRGALGQEACSSTSFLLDLSFLYQFQGAGSLAIDPQDNLLVTVFDENFNIDIVTLGTAADISAPAQLRRISGSNTDLRLHDGQWLAVDPTSGELYVYVYSYDTGEYRINVFPPYASGNIKPSRVIAGTHTQIGPTTPFAGNKIAVSADGRLFVAEPNNRILVFPPGAEGDVAPEQIIQDSTIGNTAVPQGGIAVRYSCTCP
jgi:hypothetical protein